MSLKYRDVDVNSQVTDYYQIKITNDKPSKLQKNILHKSIVTIQVFLHARMKQFRGRAGNRKAIPILEIRSDA